VPRMSIDELHRFLEEHFQQVRGYFEVIAVGTDTIEVRLPYKDEFLRPGGTLSGPALMSLADTTMYLLVLSAVGPLALAVTSSLNIHFLRKPPPVDVIATARMLKLGRRLAVGDVHMVSAADGGLVAQATVSYALPSNPG
jgi:uncharacterized protein (TIGR00369 family)